MREIKFRAWDKQQKWMIYDIQETCNGLSSNKNIDEINEFYNYISNIESFISDMNFEIMQYIGLKDNNGVEIYEGDVIGSENNDSDTWYVSHHEVVWHDTGFMGKQICSSSFIGLDYWTSGKNGYVVIGNIYENPELLEN